MPQQFFHQLAIIKRSDQLTIAPHSATLRGGLGGGAIGLAAGTLGVYAASARYPAFRSLTLPFRAFLIASSGTFAAIVSADHYSRRFEMARRSPQESPYVNAQAQLRSQLEAAKPVTQRAADWAGRNRYSIVFAAWLGSMAGALALVGRNPYLTVPQKLVQARVYAQGLTVAVLLASFAFEANDSAKGQGRWETVQVLDPDDPEHKHVIEKRIHHERYAGEDQWKGELCLLLLLLFPPISAFCDAISIPLSKTACLSLLYGKLFMNGTIAQQERQREWNLLLTINADMVETEERKMKEKGRRTANTKRKEEKGEEKVEGEGKEEGKEEEKEDDKEKDKDGDKDEEGKEEGKKEGKEEGKKEEKDEGKKQKKEEEKEQKRKQKQKS